MTSHLDCIIRGGTVVSDDSVARLDVGIADGQIAALSESLSAQGAREIDAGGCVVIPGAVDVHTHFANTLGVHGQTADDYWSGTRAAAAGGITTVINYAFQERGESLANTVERERGRANGSSLIDYGFHVGVTDITDSPALGEFARLGDEGITSVKVFTTVEIFRLSDRDLLRVLEQARTDQLLVNIHAEDDALIEHLTEKQLKSAPDDIRSLALSRPDEAEALAVERSATYARAVGCPIYIVHVSSAAALRTIRRARRAGGAVYAEARPAYLFLDESCYDLPAQQGRRYASVPPLRPLSDQRALWRALVRGEIQTYATDHTTWKLSTKTDPTLNFAEVPGGIPDVQTSVGMLFSEGVSRRRMPLLQFAKACSTNPAKIFGLWPRKGRLAVGSDADIVVLDPALELRLDELETESQCDYLPYAGYVSKGWPVLTMSRGEVICERGRITGEKGRGRFLVRGRHTSAGMMEAGIG